MSTIGGQNYRMTDRKRSPYARSRLSSVDLTSLGRRVGPKIAMPKKQGIDHSLMSTTWIIGLQNISRGNTMKSPSEIVMHTSFITPTAMP